MGITVFILALLVAGIFSAYRSNLGKFLDAVASPAVSGSYPDSVQCFLVMVSGVRRSGRLIAVGIFACLFLFALSALPWYAALASPFLFLLVFVASWTLLPGIDHCFYHRRFDTIIRRLCRQCGISEDAAGEIVQKAIRRVLEEDVPPGGLSAAEMNAARKTEVYCVYYDDRFEQFSGEASSFLHSVCPTMEDADELVATRPLYGAEYLDGYQRLGPYNLAGLLESGVVSADGVRRLMRGERCRPEETAG